MELQSLRCELDSLLSEVVGLGVIVFKGGEEIFSYFGGRRQLNPDKPMTRKTLLRAASLSKMFTVFTILQLVEAGKLNLSDDVSDHLGFKLRNPNCPDMPITIEQLARHTSSIIDGLTYVLPPQRTLKDFFTDGTRFAKTIPGEYFHYCNLNYGLLGTVIERVTGERFDIYQREHILKQLNISGGYLVEDLSSDTLNNLGTLYQRKDGSWLASVDECDGYDFSGYKVGTNATGLSPQGGLKISFEDLGKCLQMMMSRGEFNGRQIISQRAFDTMIGSHWIFNGTNGLTYGGVMENYGLGTYRVVGTSKARLCEDCAIDLIGHSGEALGLVSGLYFMPNTRDGLLFMINGATLEAGKFSANYACEEAVVNPICKHILGGRNETAAV